MGEELTIGRQAGLHCHDGGFHAEVKWSVHRRFKHHFQCPGTLFRRSTQDAAIPLANDSTERGESIDDRGLIARQELRGRRQGWFQKMLAKEATTDKSVETVGGIIFMKGNDDIVTLSPQFGFELLYFWLVRTTPEFTIQVQTRPGMTCFGR